MCRSHLLILRCIGSAERNGSIRTVTIAVVATLLAVYIGGVIFHMHRFGVIDDQRQECSRKSVQSVEDMLLSDARKYTLDIKFKDSDFTFVLGDADSDVALTDSVDTLLKKHSPFLWFVNSFHSYDYKIDYTVNCDREKLEACLQASPALDRMHATSCSHNHLRLDIRALIHTIVILRNGCNRGEITPPSPGIRIMPP